jgi:PAS domain S-box-containing protein
VNDLHHPDHRPLPPTTDPERLLAALRESEAMFRATFEQAAVGMAHVAPDGTWLRVNQRLCDIVGYDREEMLRLSFQDITHPDDLDTDLAQVRQMLAGEIGRYRMEKRYRCRGGDIVWVDLTVSLVRDEGTGAPLYFISVVEDIDARKRAQAEVEEQAELLRLSQDAIAVRRFDGTVLSWNPAAERLYGWTEAEARGRITHELLQTRFPVSLEEQERALLTAGHWEGELVHARRDGRLVSVSSRQSLRRAPDGSPDLVLEANRDITEERRAREAERASLAALRELTETLEERVQERTAALQEANASLESFNHVVAHDLRAPLRAMQGFAQALAEDYAPELDDEARDFIGRIVEGADRMNALLTDLLAYSRLTRADLRAALAPVSLDLAVADALRALEAEVAARGARVSVEGTPLPSVLGHRSTLAQVVMNLIGNAVKFVPAGVTPEVRVWAELQGDGGTRVRLWVEDNGIGIAPEHRERIWRVFERLHGVEQYPGTGVGLAIVAKAMERMGGTAGVESAPGRGSRFWVELPRPGKP